MRANPLRVPVAKPLRRAALGALFVLGLCWVPWMAAKLLPAPALLEGVPFSRLILDRHGTMLRLGLAKDQIYRLPCRLEELHPDLIRGTLLYEDRWFFKHPGVNPLSLTKAFFTSYLSGGRRMGGSTITMQVARLRHRMRTSTLPGKAAQIFMALRLEAHYSKQEILEAYFNLAPYGANIEGAEAAARIYFQSPASGLDLSECLALAVIPQNPGKRGPLRPDQTDALAARSRLAAMWDETLPGEAVDQPPNHIPPLPSLARLPDPAVLPVRVGGPAALPFAAPHLSTFLLQDAAAPDQVRTTIDLPLQEELERVMTRHAGVNAALGAPNAGALLVHWPDMEIRAVVGSADFHNPGIQGQIDASRIRRSPGSTLKPFIYALALDQGLIHPLTVLADAPRSFRGYDPENMDQAFMGPLPARLALSMSRNIPAISLAARLRHPDLYGFLTAAGVAFERSEEHYGLSLVLGGAEITMREMAGLYAMLANQGLWRAPRHTSAEGEPPVRLLSPEAAFITLDMLREPNTILISGPDKRSLPVYLKTGTSNGYRDAWCAGLFGPYVLIAWCGNFDNTSSPALVGRSLAVPLFLDIADSVAGMEPLHDGLAQPAASRLTRIPVCSATGDLDVDLCPEDFTEVWFIPGVSPVTASGVLGRILMDEDSGLRACVETDSTREVVWEFWPGDLARIFRQAGINKPPPPDWMPGCEDHALAAGGPSTGGLRIETPKEGIVYHRRLNEPENPLRLTATAPADSRSLFWFAGSRLLGRAEPGSPLLWSPDPGVTEVRVVDDKGRSDRIRLQVETAH